MVPRQAGEASRVGAHLIHMQYPFGCRPVLACCSCPSQNFVLSSLYLCRPSDTNGNHSRMFKTISPLFEMDYLSRIH